MRHIATLATAATLLASAASAQTAVNLNALDGLAPFSALPNTTAGKAALAANYTITGAIQTGTANQPLLEPFPAQQAQALKDADILPLNGSEFADGLGTSLSAAYLAKASYTGPKTFTSISPDVTNLFAYSYTLTGADSNAGKFFFSNATYKTGKTPAVPVSAAAMAIMTQFGGTTDVFGKAYGLPAGAPGADPYGDSRPFQTEKTVLHYTDPDYFGAASGNVYYLSGPAQDLTASPSFPSGHTTYGYTESTLLAILVPSRYPQMIVRGAEYGNDRIILGAHYAMDIIGGRTLAYYDLAQLLSGNKAYLGQKEGKAKPIANYLTAVKKARKELAAALGAGGPDTSRFADATKDAAFYESTQTYGLPAVYPAKVEPVPAQAGYLLTAAFPYLSLSEADKILTSTEGPGGGFLDNGSAFGVYSRLDLYKAGLEAESMAK